MAQAAEKVPITLDESLKLQKELYCALSDDEFQERLEELEERLGKACTNYTPEHTELFLSVLNRVMPNYGYAEGQRGMLHMLWEAERFNNNMQFVLNRKILNQMLGLEAAEEEAAAKEADSVERGAPRRLDGRARRAGPTTCTLGAGERCCQSVPGDRRPSGAGVPPLRLTASPAGSACTRGERTTAKDASRQARVGPAARELATGPSKPQGGPGAPSTASSAKGGGPGAGSLAPSGRLRSNRADVVPTLVHPPSWGEVELLALLELAKKGRYTGRGFWVEYFPGEGAMVISSPHDGTCRPDGIPRRSEGVMVRDTGTRGVAAAMALELLRRGVERPHLLVCHLVRNRLDVNRPREHAASDPVALCVWDRYHELLSKAICAARDAAPQRALFMDIHAQANYRYHGVDAIELGTLCPCAEDLHRGKAHLDELARTRLQAARRDGAAGAAEDLVAHLKDLFTMPRLAAQVLLRARSFSELLLGPQSLGAFLDRRGFRAVPSPAFEVPPPTVANPKPQPGDAMATPRPPERPGHAPDHFYCGSASYPLHVSPNVLDAVQLECPVRLTKEPNVWAPLAGAIIGSLEDLYRDHLQLELYADALS